MERGGLITAVTRSILSHRHLGIYGMGLRPLGRFHNSIDEITLIFGTSVLDRPDFRLYTHHATDYAEVASGRNFENFWDLVS